MPIKDHEYYLRWFMPEGEINLNGHATLASAYILFNQNNFHEIHFHTKSGVLTITKENDYIILDLPAIFNHPIEISEEMIEALGIKPKEAYFKENLFLVYKNEKEIRQLTPNFEKMKQSIGQGVFVSALSSDPHYDIVGRTFWPKTGVNEDPVCGNMHCNLTPFWCERLHKIEIISHQLSKREATVICIDYGERVKLKGKAIQYMKGTITL